MKTLMLKRKLWVKTLFLLMIGIFALLAYSCDKETFEEQLLANTSFMTALKPTGNNILYYQAESFRIVSNEPVVVIRSLENEDFKYLEKFVLKVKNGDGSSNKNVKLEIKIDGIVVVTSKDFTKRKNIVLKELPELSASSTMEVWLEGPKNKSVDVLIECSLQEDVLTDNEGNYYHLVKIDGMWGFYYSDGVYGTLYLSQSNIQLTGRLDPYYWLDDQVVLSISKVEKDSVFIILDNGRSHIGILDESGEFMSGNTFITETNDEAWTWYAIKNDTIDIPDEY